MRIMKRYLVWLVVATIVVFSTLAYSAEKVTIDYWSVFAERGEMIRLIDEFNKANPNINVKAITAKAGKFHEKLIVAIAGGVPPDLADITCEEVVNWAINGAIQPLTKFLERDGIDPAETWFPYSINTNYWKGELYEVPYQANLWGLFYNKVLFKEVGLDPDQPPRTFAELDEYAEKITLRDTQGKYERLGFVPWSGPIFLINYIWMFGGELWDPEAFEVTVNDEASMKALEWMYSYVEKYGFEAVKGFTGGFGVGEADPFITGDIGMSMNGNWALGFFDQYAYTEDFDYGVASWPQAPGGSYPMSWGSAWGACIPTEAEYPDQAWELLKYLGGEYFQREYCLDLGDFPANIKAAADPMFREAFGGKQGVFMDLLPFAKNYPPREFPGGQLLWNEMMAATDYALEGRKTLKEAMDDVVDKVNAFVAQYRP